MNKIRGFFRIAGTVLFVCIVLFICSLRGPVWVIEKVLERLPKKPSVYMINFSQINKYEQPALFSGGIKRAILDGRVDFKDGKLILHGQSQNGKFKIKEWKVIDCGCKYADLRVKAESDKWSPDTSIGFEMWGESYRGEPAPYDGIVFKNGSLKITNSNYYGQNEYIGPVADWETIKKKPVVVEIVWTKETVQLEINGKVRSLYRGILIPQKYLNCRINVDRDQDDRLLIYDLFLEH